MFMSAMVQIFSWGDKMKCSIQVELNGKFHLSPKKIFVPLHEGEAFIICFIYKLHKDSNNPKQIYKKKF